MLEVLLLLLVPLPLWRFVCVSPFGRLFPRKTLALALVPALYSGIVLFVAFAVPAALRSLAVFVGLGLIYFWWRSRPSYGQRRRWPPGQLKLLPSEPYSNPGFYRSQSERFGPVFKTGATHPYPTLRPVACIVGHELGLDVLRRHDASLKVRPEFPFSRFISRGFLRHMEPKDHAKYSRLFHSAMAMTTTRFSSESIATTIRLTLNELTINCARARTRGIRPDGHLREMLFGLFSQIFFGITPGTVEFNRLQELHKALNFSGITRRTRRAQIETNRVALIDFLGKWARRIGEGEMNEPVARACVLAAISEIDTVKVDDPTVIGNLAYLLEISRNDVTGLLMWLIKMLKDHPAWLTELRKHPNAPPVRGSLASHIVSETLRLEQSEYLYRHTIRAIDVADYIIPKGWVLRICIRDAHRDPAIFDDAERFCPRRFETNDYPLTSYAPFGLFRHMCIGADLTMMIGCVFVHELAHKFAFHAVDDGQPEHSRFHWEPSARFRVHIERRS